MRTSSTVLAPEPVLDALEDVVRACGVGPVTVVVSTKRVAALAHVDSRKRQITLDPRVAAAALAEPEMIRFLLAHEIGHVARSTRSWTSLTGGGFLLLLVVWFVVFASLGAAEVTTGRSQWWIYSALVALFLVAWALAAQHDRASELGCDDYAGAVGYPLSESAAASLHRFGTSRVRLPLFTRTHPDWATRLRNAQHRFG